MGAGHCYVAMLTEHDIRPHASPELGLTLSRIFLLVAVVCFVLAAVGVDLTGVDLVAIGPALGFGSFLVT